MTTPDDPADPDRSGTLSSRPLLVGLGASLVAFLLLALGWTVPVEGLVMDLFQRLDGPREAHPEVAIVAIDAEAVDRLGRWPWPRPVMARLIERLAEADASVIALDVVFSEPSRPVAGVDPGEEDEALARALAASDRAVLSFFFRVEPPVVTDRDAPDPGDLAGPLAPAAFEVVLGDPAAVPLEAYPAVEVNLPLFARVARGQGFTTNRRDQGVARLYALAARHGATEAPGAVGAVYPALPLRAVALHRGASLVFSASPRGLPSIAFQGPGDDSRTGTSTGTGRRPLSLDARARLWIDHPGPPGTVPTHSASAVLDGRVGADELAGRVVFVGATEAGIGDLVATPWSSQVPGVEVHAAVADNLLGGHFLVDRGWPHGLSLLALLLLGPAAALLVSLVDESLTASALGLALVAAWPVLAFVAFAAAGWHLQVVAPTLAGTLALVVSLRGAAVRATRRARFIRRTFQRYVSAAVVEEMLRHPERVRLGGERREMTVLFSDIRGFTTLSEGLDPEALVAVLNRFFTPMTALVLDHGGTLDKYMGDALMAFFGAPVAHPDHPRRACRSALAMVGELERINVELAAEGALPEGAAIGVGVGLATGPMAVGNMGSEAVFDYTVIGDTVNLGSRIEGLNKAYGTAILVSDATARAVGEGFALREVDRVAVKGKTRAVGVWELLAERPAAAALEDRVERWSRARALFLERRFAEASRVLETLLENHPEDRPAGVFLERCRTLAADPPGPDWDGITRATTK